MKQIHYFLCLEYLKKYLEGLTALMTSDVKITSWITKLGRGLRKFNEV